MNCRGVIFLPYAKELEKDDVQKEKIQAEQKRKDKKKRECCLGS